MDVDAVAALARRLGEAMAQPGATAAAVAAVAGGAVRDDGPPLPAYGDVDVDGVLGVSVTRRWDSDEPNTAEIKLGPGLALSDVESRLGAARPATRLDPDARRMKLDGDDARWTVLVVLDEDGTVRSLTIRRDAG